MANHLHLLGETGAVLVSWTMQTSYDPGNSKPAPEIEKNEAGQFRKTDLKQVLWGMESGWERRKMNGMRIGGVKNDTIEPVRLLQNSTQLTITVGNIVARFLEIARLVNSFISPVGPRGQRLAFRIGL